MEDNLEELRDEEYNTDYESLYRNYTKEELETELYNANKEYSGRKQDGVYVKISGQLVVPGTRKISELERLISEKAEEEEAAVEEEPEEEIEEEEEEEPEEIEEEASEEE